jgi:hypothetical protein
MMFAAFGYGQAPKPALVLTWNGLHFHDTEDAIKEQMAAAGLPLSASGEKGSFRAEKDYELTAGLRMPFLFKPELTFRSSGLEEVTLSLDVEKMVATGEGNLDNLTVAVGAAQNLHDAISSKYAPLDQSGACNHATVEYLMRSPRLVHCDEHWKGESQTLTVSWSYVPAGPWNQNTSRFSYYLSYKPKANGL